MPPPERLAFGRHSGTLGAGQSGICSSGSRTVSADGTLCAGGDDPGRGLRGDGAVVADESGRASQEILEPRPHPSPFSPASRNASAAGTSARFISTACSRLLSKSSIAS